MSTVAEQLRAAREAKNLTVEEVADLTKIRTDHIRALEEGNFNVFSAPIYIRGSVKNYATALKLDTTAMLATLAAELKGTEKYSEPPPLSESKKTLFYRKTPYSGPGTKMKKYAVAHGPNWKQTLKINRRDYLVK